VRTESFRQLILIFILNSSNNWRLSFMHHAMLCLFLWYSFLSLTCTIFRSWRHMSRRSNYCYTASKVSAGIIVYEHKYCSCVWARSLYRAAHVHQTYWHLWPTTPYEQNVAEQHSSRPIMLAQRYFFWPALRSIRFVLRSKRLLQWPRRFQAYCGTCEKL